MLGRPLRGLVGPPGLRRGRVIVFRSEGERTPPGSYRSGTQISGALIGEGHDDLGDPQTAETYFHRTGPIGQVFAAYQDKLADRHVGLIGLGSGTLASYGQPGQRQIRYINVHGG